MKYNNPFSDSGTPLSPHPKVLPAPTLQRQRYLRHYSQSKHDEPDGEINLMLKRLIAKENFILRLAKRDNPRHNHVVAIVPSAVTPKAVRYKYIQLSICERRPGSSLSSEAPDAYRQTPVTWRCSFKSARSLHKRCCALYEVACRGINGCSFTVTPPCLSFLLVNLPNLAYRVY